MNLCQNTSHTKYFLKIVTAIFIFSPCLAAMAADIQPDALDYKIIENGKRYTKVSFKFQIRNNEEPREMFIKIAGKDSAGFELERVNISLKLNAEESRTVTKIDSVSNDNLQKIVVWEFGDIKQFPLKK